MTSAEIPVVIAGYSASPEAADGLALGHLLAGLTDRALLVARVIPDVPEHPGATRAEQLHVRDVVQDTTSAVLAAVADGSVDVMPVLDMRVATGLHDLARTQNAALITLGSSHHHSLGRVLLGGTAEQVVDGAPCPVAVAPPRFTDSPVVRPPVIGVAWDGTGPSRDAMAFAVEMASVTGMDLRVIHVHPGIAHKPLGGGAHSDIDEGVALAIELGGPGVAVTGSRRSGDPAGELIAETREDVGLLVIGSRGHGALARVLLGTVSGHVMRGAHAPVLVVPPTS